METTRHRVLTSRPTKGRVGPPDAAGVGSGPVRSFDGDPWRPAAAKCPGVGDLLLIGIACLGSESAHPTGSAGVSAWASGPSAVISVLGGPGGVVRQQAGDLPNRDRSRKFPPLEAGTELDPLRFATRAQDLNLPRGDAGGPLSRERF